MDDNEDHPIHLDDDNQTFLESVEIMDIYKWEVVEETFSAGEYNSWDQTARNFYNNCGAQCPVTSRETNKQQKKRVQKHIFLQVAVDASEEARRQTDLEKNHGKVNK